MTAFVSWAAPYISPNCFKRRCCFSQGKIASGWRSHPPQARPPGSSIKFQFSAGKSWRSNNYQKARQLLHGIYLHGKHQRTLTEGMANATPSQQPRKWLHYLCSFRCKASTITGLPQIMLQHLSSYVPDKTCVEKAVYRSLSINPQAKGSSRQQSSAVPATEPVAVIPLA